MAKTLAETPTIDQLLRDRRDGGPKTEAAREIGVSRQIYDTWETGHYVPGDDWAEPLSVYLGVDLAEIVWILYRSRINRVNPRYRDTTVGRAAYPSFLAAA